MQPGHIFHGQALQDLVVLTTQREQPVCVRSQRAPKIKLVRREVSQLHGMICDEETHRDSTGVYNFLQSGKM